MNAWELILPIPLGLALDAALGDPVFAAHPVRLMGTLASFVEGWSRRVFKAKIAGAVSWLAVVGGAAMFALGGTALARALHPAFGIAFGAALVWSSVALRDLCRHAADIRSALDGGNLPDARIAVGRIVGRDTECLDERGISKACVESVAESSVDGVCAPIFWAAVLGPWAAFAFRAINTLDSMFGHKDERYLNFGFISARADDVAAFLPARLASAIVLPAAALVGFDVCGAARVFLRDRKRHESPNAGHPEAAYAGALGLELGGTAFYGGASVAHPCIGVAQREANSTSIASAVRLLVAQTTIFACCCLAFVFVLLLIW